MDQDDLHAAVRARLRRTAQRYTDNRRALVEAMAGAAQPLTVQQLLDLAPSVVQSSAYRNLAVLEQADAVRRVVTTDEFARYELAQDLTGHHHHLVCTSCGEVTDIVLPASFEADMETMLRTTARSAGFTPTDHNLDVIGTCATCA